ncbi:MAG: hypothetical protein M3O46_12490, partial [Myxococcota bacterium]|nr:hypothetical protein [Myxococcota bacterium]
MRFRLPLTLSILALASVVSAAPAAQSVPRPMLLRWTDATPDAMVDDAVARATASNENERSRAAAIATIAALAERARGDHAKDALAEIAATPSVPVDLRAEASLVERTLAPDEGTEDGGRADRALGVADELWMLGPFRDTGGGIEARDGPEIAGSPFNPKADYSWGSYEVAWRKVPREFASARGIPLDLFVFPRTESCTWVATHLIARDRQSLTLYGAATGQVRLVFDGAEIARDESVHESALFDRIAARVDIDAGEHLLSAKVCSGALADKGRVRLRVTNAAGKWPEGVLAEPRLWDKAPVPAKRLTVRSVTTPLGRAIGKPSSDVDGRLQEAILRTLGGADDLRSPRAPGILAALSEGPLDPDRLAMAAWIAPSGANRSAWLNHARSAADAGTRAFVDRRLVERHLDAQL